MATAPLFPAQIGVIFQALTLAVPNMNLSTDPSLPQPAKPGPFSVRIGWQTQGQPAQAIDQDIVYLRLIEEDNRYNRVRNVGYTGVGNFQKIVNYTRAWHCYWTIYGPNSFENARVLHSALLTDDATRALLAGASLYFVPDAAAPLRAPEIWPGKEWVERVDFSALFYEEVVETQTAQPITSAEVVVIESRLGELADVVIEQ